MIFFLFSISEDAVPYFRKIQPEEFWLYRFPRTDSFYPGYLLWVFIVIYFSSGNFFISEIPELLHSFT